MNGSFTSSESRYLTPDERMHYSELGLCAPIDGSELDCILERTTSREVETLKDELYDLENDHDEAVEDLGNLQLKVNECLAFLDSMDGAALACDIKAHIQSLLR